MGFQSWLDNMSGLVSVHSFDISPYGSCGKQNVPLYSYVNAHGFWIKDFYLPIPSPENGQT